MSEVDIYDETENLISSEEDYSEDDDDDDLMNAAITSKDNIKPQTFKYPISTSFKANKNKILQNALLIKRKKIGILYKRKSLKWLNDKGRRGKAKVNLQSLMNRNKALTEIRKFVARDKSCEISEVVQDIKKKDEKNTTVITLDTDEIEFVPCIDVPSPKIQVQEKIIVKMDKRSQTVANVPNLAEHNKETQTEKIIPKVEAHKEPQVKSNQETQTEPQSETGLRIKRQRSPSPPITQNHVRIDDSPRCDSNMATSAAFYREINKLFPKYDQALGNHLKSKSSTIDGIEEGMTQAFLEIQTLNELIQAKEVECNRLYYLKSVKEEILTRFIRKKKVADFKKKKYGDKYSLPELKELEFYLSSSRAQSSHTTTQQLIENRANMKTEELYKERNNTNKLQSLLSSTKILPQAVSNLAALRNDITQNTTSSTVTNSLRHLDAYKYLEKKENKMGRQGPFKDVQSIIADFRQKNPEVSRPVGKRFKFNEPIPTNRCETRAVYESTPISESNNLSNETSFNMGNVRRYTPRLEKLLNTSRGNNSAKSNCHQTRTSNSTLSNEQPTKYYTVQVENGDDCNEVTLVPVVNSSPFLSQSQGYRHDSSQRATHAEPDYVYIDEVNDSFSENVMRRENKMDIEKQVCQKCSREARFVCAGCGNQWYCSRDCQISDWDQHSETCADE